MAAMAMSTVSLGGLDVIFALHSEHEPRPEEWQKFTELVAGVRTRNGGNNSRSRQLVITDGGAPNAKQREMLTEAFGGTSSKVAVITTTLTNPLKRGIATAITWVNPTFKALPPAQWLEALKHLDLQDQVQPILLEFGRLQAKLPPINSLALFVASTKNRVA